MLVNPQASNFRVEHDGRTYYFCSPGCLEKFHREPAKYLGSGATLRLPAPAPEKPDQVATEIDSTCPMHPEVRKRGPGACPIVGMALETFVAPTPAPGEASADPELANMTRRFRACLALTAPILLLARL